MPKETNIQNYETFLYFGGFRKDPIFFTVHIDMYISGRWFSHKSIT